MLNWNICNKVLVTRVTRWKNHLGTTGAVALPQHLVMLRLHLPVPVGCMLSDMSPEWHLARVEALTPGKMLRSKTVCIVAALHTALLCCTRQGSTMQGVMV